MAAPLNNKSDLISKLISFEKDLNDICVKCNKDNDVWEKMAANITSATINKGFFDDVNGRLGQVENTTALMKNGIQNIYDILSECLKKKQAIDIATVESLKKTVRCVQNALLVEETVLKKINIGFVNNLQSSTVDKSLQNQTVELLQLCMKNLDDLKNTINIKFEGNNQNNLAVNRNTLLHDSLSGSGYVTHKPLSGPKRLEKLKGVLDNFQANFSKQSIEDKKTVLTEILTRVVECFSVDPDGRINLSGKEGFKFLEDLFDDGSEAGKLVGDILPDCLKATTFKIIDEYPLQKRMGDKATGEIFTAKMNKVLFIKNRVSITNPLIKKLRHNSVVNFVVSKLDKAESLVNPKLNSFLEDLKKQLVLENSDPNLIFDSVAGVLSDCCIKDKSKTLPDQMLHQFSIDQQRGGTRTILIDEQQKFIFENKKLIDQDKTPIEYTTELYNQIKKLLSHHSSDNTWTIPVQAILTQTLGNASLARLKGYFAFLTTGDEYKWTDPQNLVHNYTMIDDTPNVRVKVIRDQIGKIEKVEVDVKLYSDVLETVQKVENKYESVLRVGVLSSNLKFEVTLDANNAPIVAKFQLNHTFETSK